MKKIINGVRYNTDIANCVGLYRYKKKGDIDYINEGLYKTYRSNKYFLAGEGGINTKYLKNISQKLKDVNMKIIPLSEKQANEWAKRYLNKSIN